MKEIEIKATTGSKEKGNLKEFSGKCSEYESVEEAVKMLKKEGVLALLNKMVKTDALNALRKPPTDPIIAALKKAIAAAPTPEAKTAIEKQVKEIAAKYGIKIE